MKKDNTNIYMVVLFFVFWSIISTWYYVCPIKGFCKTADMPITQAVKVPTIVIEPEIKNQDSIINEQIDRTVINFEFDSNNKITNNEVLNYLAKLARQLESSSRSVSITGHTDSLGNESYNEKLGLGRANAIKNILIKNGLTSNMITTKSMGEREPVATNETNSGQLQNRRVELFY